MIGINWEALLAHLLGDTVYMHGVPCGKVTGVEADGRIIITMSPEFYGPVDHRDLSIGGEEL